MRCLDPNQAAEFAQGIGRPSPNEQVEAHLAECAHCRRLVAFVASSRECTRAEMPPPANLDDLEGRIGRYAVRSELGHGGASVVYRAHDPIRGRDVAIKLTRLSPIDDHRRQTMRDGLIREGQLLARIRHPNVVTLYGMGVYEDDVYLALELVGGGTMRAWCANPHRPVRDRIQALLGAGYGLAAAHRAGVVHGDVKPDNLALGVDGRAKLLDFGSAWARSTTADGHRSKRSASPPPTRAAGAGATGGTVAYMAPEAIAGQPSDELSDQYSFCVSAWELLTGLRPQPTAASRWPAAAPAGMSPATAEVFAKGLARDRRGRYSSVSMLLRALERTQRSQ
jgi:eukaryotic-like serine/threonine-protein kinase